MRIHLAKVSVVLPTGRDLFFVPQLDIAAGERLLIQGASGRGKTTLLHLLAGLFLPASGVVEIGDQRLTTMSDDERCNLRREKFGIVFQKLNLIEHLTALENVRLALLPDKDVDATALKSLREVQLEARAHDRAATMSVGEQQRVAVARVLAARPEIILADEPTSSLDDMNAEFVMKSLFKAAEGRTLVVVSHDARVKKAFDRVVNFTEWAK
jgi:ABC-type lipoprotein export system ATPase subunit